MTKIKHKFTVVRSKWLRGKASCNVPSSLLNEEGHRCCLGFLAKSCKVPDKVLLGNATLIGVIIDAREAHTKIHPGMRKVYALLSDGEVPTTDKRLAHQIMDDPFIQDLYEENDYTYGIERKEERLTRLFAKAGIQVTFVD